MSNAPKTGFWQTIPGLITATAGFLSAATGAIVALNQTGVVDLKKISGTKPPEQVAMSPDSAATPTKESAAAEKPASEQSTTEPVKPQDAVPAKTETAGSPPVTAKMETAVAPATTRVEESKPAAEPKPIEPAKAQPTATTTAEPRPAVPAPSTVEQQQVVQQPVRQPESVPAQPTKVSEPTSVPQRVPPPSQPNPGPATRVVESRPVEAPPQSAPVRPAPPTTTMPPANATTDARNRPSTGAPSQPVSREPVPAPTRQPTSERLADARNPEPAPMPRPQEPVDGQPRVVRAPSDDSGKGKTRVVERPAPGGREPAPGAVREARPGAVERGRELDLTGLKMTIPSGWVRVETETGAMAAEATLRIADPTGDGTVQISRFMGSKGKEMEDKAIDRWLGQVVGVRGGPVGRGDAKIERRQNGPMRITTVEIAGTVRPSPRDPGPPNQRMMGVIVDHPLGPHLITITGPADAFTRWSAAIDGFLNSAKPE